MSKRSWYDLMWVVFVILLLTACNEKKEPMLDQPVELKVMHWNEDSFYSEYGDMISAKYPNLTFKVLPVQGIFGDKLAEFVEKEKPDLIMLNTAREIGLLKEKGQLAELDPYISKDKFDLDTINPRILDMLREEGEGKLYTLSPTFQGEGLYYNKDLFDKHGVPYPTDQMTWEEVLELAARIPKGTKENPLYGLDMNNTQPSFFFTMNLGQTEGLQFIDLDERKITLDTEGWRHIWELGIKSLKEGILAPAFSPSNKVQAYDAPSANKFINGQAAMTLQGSYFISELKRAASNAKNPQKVNWGLVTEPVSSKDRNSGRGIYIYGMYGVNSASPYKEAAWEVIKYINGDEWTRIRSRNESQLMSRTAYNKEVDGRSLEPFWKLKYSKGLIDFTKYPPNFNIDELAGVEIQQILDGNKTVEQALNDLQVSAQRALDSADKLAAENKK
ncbi:ABC transporter substrate-binding protein [Paenibacillus gansuensis]|uniref:ABC transporter substrate-binding protein n=1 Tax=Paenibacillus gansuensis TaxID=306542 RepID=A0ABW5PJR3_9BACL